MRVSMPLAADNIGSLRRTVAILFCDLSDSTGIAASMEPEVYADLLQRLRDKLAEIVPHHGGEIVRIDGDGAICIFGYPVSHEDAGRRATEAALDLHAAATALDWGLTDGSAVRLHSGIHAGGVLLRDGDMTRGRYEILGDATNVAARLCDHAESDEIVVSEATLGADRHFFRAGPRRHLSIAGRGQGVAIRSIYGREPVATRFAARSRSGLTPFAGRAAELARLRCWLAEGPAGTVLVEGRPGIGKTRFISEFLSEASRAGVAVHRGYCESYLAGRPLQPFTQLIRSITGDPAADVLDAAPDGAGAATSCLERAIVMMRGLIEQLTAGGPVIIAIDDCQWADGASLEMLDALAGTSPRVGFLLASREPAQELRLTQQPATIKLPPLSTSEAKSAIAALLAAPDPFLAEQIVEQSGGDPLIIEELCHASLRGTGQPERSDRIPPLDLLVQARFADLPAEQAGLVRTASVIGHMVPAWLFAAVAGVDIADPVLLDLAEADFIFPADVEGMLRFKHGITRDAIYSAISFKERRALHKRVAEVLGVEAERSGEPPLLEALAYHCGASGDVARAVPFAMRAGDAALAAGALDRAQEHYKSAFKAVTAQGTAGPLTDRIWPLLNKYGLACIVDPSREQFPVLQEMAKALTAVGDPRALVRTEYWLGAIAYGLGQGKRSVVHLTSALRKARELGQARFLPQIQVKLAQSMFAAGRYADADALFSRVLDLIERKEARVDDESHGYALCCHGFLHADRGDFAAAELRYRAAEAVRGDAPPLLAYLTQQSAACLFRGEWEAALAQARRCLAGCEQTRSRYHAMMANALGAYAQWQIDRDPGAVETLIGAVRWFESGRSRQRTSLIYGWLAEIMAGTGRGELARHYAACAIARAHGDGDRLGEAMAYRAAARLASQRDAAARYLAGAYRSAAVRGSLREEALTRLCEAELALRAGERARAGPLLARARAAFVEMGMARFVERAVAVMPTSR